MNATVNVKTKVSQFRAPISMVGATLGTQFFQVETRDGILDFAKRKAEIASAGNVDLYLNRSPMRARMTEHDILNISVEEDLSGNPVIVINKDNDGVAEVTIPFTQEMEKFANVTREAISAAIKGDKGKVFSNPTKVVAMINNEINNAEIARIDGLINILQKCKQAIQSTNAENEKKAKDYESQMTGAIELVNPSGTPDNTSVIVNIKTED